MAPDGGIIYKHKARECKPVRSTGRRKQAKTMFFENIGFFNVFWGKFFAKSFPQIHFKKSNAALPAALRLGERKYPSIRFYIQIS